MENDVMGQTSGSGNANPERGRIREDHATRAMEQVTARAPSQVWLWLAGASMIGSVALFATGRRQGGIFVGLWPLTFLVIGNYNKIVKSLGST